MPPNPSLAWHNLQDASYSTHCCFDNLEWPLDDLYSNYVVSVLDSLTLIAVSSRAAKYPSLIDIYSPNGKPAWRLVYNSTPQDHIVSFAFSKEDLVVLLSGGRYRVYTDFHGTFSETNIMNNIVTMQSSTDTDMDSTKDHSTEVINSLVCEQLLIIQFVGRFLLCNLALGQTYELHVDLKGETHCISAIPKEDDLELLVAHQETIVSIHIDLDMNSYTIEDHFLSTGPFEMISPSPNGKLIALCALSESRIYVVNNLYDRILMQYDSSTELSQPTQVEWCGNDVVALALKGELKLVGPGEETILFFYDGEKDEAFDLTSALNTAQQTIPILKTQSDGLMVVTPTKVEFLKRVSERAQSMFLIGSGSPASILLDCYDKLASRSCKADANIEVLKTDHTLGEALSSCLDVALHEDDLVWQKTILKVVSFAKAYTNENFDSDEYLRILNTLKVLNQLRALDNAIFITYIQLQAFGWDAIFAMLLKRNQHLVAVKIANSLLLKQYLAVIYTHWCSCKIRKELDMADGDLLTIIAKKLISASRDDRNYMPIENISRAACEEGRIDLCKMLLNLEWSVHKRVFQFLSFDEPELALILAIQAIDCDLASLLLSHLQSTLPLSQFFEILCQNIHKQRVTDSSFQVLKDAGVKLPHETLTVTGQVIGNFWVNTVAESDHKMQDLYYKQMDMQDIIYEKTLKADLARGFNSEQENNHYRANLQQADSKARSRVMSKHYKRELEIAALKTKLSQLYEQSFYQTKCLAEIIAQLVGIHQLKAAQTIARDYKFSVVALWHIVLKTYSTMDEYDRLLAFVAGGKTVDFATELNSPIGFKPFVDTCFATGAPATHTSIYIRNCRSINYTDRVALFVKNEDFQLAAQEAQANKDMSLLKSLLPQVDGNTRPSIEEMISKMR